MRIFHFTLLYDILYIHIVYYVYMYVTHLHVIVMYIYIYIIHINIRYIYIHETSMETDEMCPMRTGVQCVLLYSVHSPDPLFM